MSVHFPQSVIRPLFTWFHHISSTALRLWTTQISNLFTCKSVEIFKAQTTLNFVAITKQYKKSGRLTIADRCALIFKVTQGHWLIQWKTYIHDFLLVINLDLSSISHRLQHMVPRSWKPSHPILRPPDQGTPLNIVIKLNSQITVV